MRPSCRFRGTLAPWLALVVLLSAGCTRSRSVDFPMTWEFADDDALVFLVFRDFPKHYLTITDRTLREHLERRDASEIVVTLEVWTRLGCVERLRSSRVDGRDDWVREWAGSGWIDSRHPSPWDRYHCKLPWR